MTGSTTTESAWRSPRTIEAAAWISARTGVTPRVPMISLLVMRAPSQCVTSMSSWPERPGKRYFSPPEKPTTSCGRTGPTMIVTSLSTTSRFTRTSTASSSAPDRELRRPCAGRACRRGRRWCRPTTRGSDVELGDTDQRSHGVGVHRGVRSEGDDGGAGAHPPGRPPVRWRRAAAAEGTSGSRRGSPGRANGRRGRARRAAARRTRRTTVVVEELARTADECRHWCPPSSSYTVALPRGRRPRPPPVRDAGPGRRTRRRRRPRRPARAGPPGCRRSPGRRPLAVAGRRRARDDGGEPGCATSGTGRSSAVARVGGPSRGAGAGAACGSRRRRPGRRCGPGLGWRTGVAPRRRTAGRSPPPADHLEHVVDQARGRSPRRPGRRRRRRWSRTRRAGRRRRARSGVRSGARACDAGTGRRRRRARRRRHRAGAARRLPR